MPEYMFRAANSERGEIKDRIEATNLGQARYMLEIRGYRDIEFYSDEGADDIKRAVLSGTDVPEGDPELWTAEDEAAAWRRKGIGAQLWWAFQQNLIVIAPLAFWNWSSWRGARPFSALDWAGFVATPLYLAYFLFLSTPMVVFQRLLESAAWCEWKQVYRYVAWARRLRAIGIRAIPASELDFREAYAMAAEGRTEQALQLLEKYRGDPDMAEYLFLGRLSSVYEYAGSYDKMIALLEESAAKGPGGASEWIDLAVARVRRGRDIAGAKAALARTADKEIAALPGAALAICEGIIASEEREDDRACEQLEKGLGKLDAYAGNPLIQVMVAEAKAYLAISQARRGAREEANKTFAAVGALLKARNETDLLERCTTALGLTNRSFA
jgi:hypothetical protein